ncbi:ABC transporter permease [Paeniglutamicibacter sp. R2-26]|uniref:ABC transporter permease n=1 Tax=Paeniglutamicibacter sp. R2-26 TaxID=3144417 RepID=UPI003EE796D6
MTTTKGIVETTVAPTRARVRRAPRRRLDFLGTCGVVLFALCLLAGLGGHLGVLGDPGALVGPRLSEGGPGYPWGTDELGRSLLARIAEGIGTTVLLSVTAVAAGALLGTLLGCISAYRGGWVDEVISRFADILFGFPLIIVAILVTVAVGPGQFSAMCGILVATVPLLLRTVRAKVLEVAGRDYIVVARVAGAGMWRVMFTHLLPNARGVIILQVAYSLSVAMLIEGALSFLGFGVQLPSASLGSLIGFGRQYLFILPAYTLLPALVLAVAVLSVNLIGDGIQRYGDPTPRRRRTPRKARA